MHACVSVGLGGCVVWVGSIVHTVQHIAVLCGGVGFDVGLPQIHLLKQLVVEPERTRNHQEPPKTIRAMTKNY